MSSHILINSASISDRGLSEKRPENEDSFLELRDSRLYAVADGVGGAQAGEVASKMAMEILAEAFVNLQDDGDAETRMRQAIEKANSAIFQMSNDLPQLNSMATTVVALHINDTVATIGHVGDSRLYRMDPEGNLYQETLDHSVVEEEVRAGRMSPEQAAVHPSRNVISRAVGAEPLVEIDLKRIDVAPNTAFIACSDGVTRHIDDEELRQMLIETEDADEVCQRIKAVCFERGAEDNLTAVVVRTEGTAEIFEAEEVPVDEIPDDEVVIPVSAEEPAESGIVADETSEVSVEEEVVVSAEEPAEPAQEEYQAGDQAGDESLASEELDEGSDASETEAEEEAKGVGEGDGDGDGDGEGISMGAIQGSEFLSILSPDQDEAVDGPASADAELTEEITGGGGGLLAKVVGGALLFVIGVVLGGAAVYIGTRFLSSAPELPAEVVTQNVPLTTFEQTKQRVYGDPRGYIAALSANPANAEDQYFLGLAYLLTKEYDKSRESLLKASESLGEFDEAGRQSLSREIAVARAIVENPDALTAFEKNIAGGGEDSDATGESQSGAAGASNQ